MYAKIIKKFDLVVLKNIYDYCHYCFASGTTKILTGFRATIRMQI